MPSRWWARSSASANDQGQHLLALRVARHVAGPVVPVRLDGIGKGAEAGQDLVVVQMPLKGIDARGDAVDGVADVVENGVEHLHAPFGEGLRQRFLRLRLGGDVAEDGDRPPDVALGVEQGPHAGAHEEALPAASPSERRGSSR